MITTGALGRRSGRGHTEYTCVVVENVQEIEAKLPWEILDAIHEMLQTAWGFLVVMPLRLSRGDRLLR